MSSNAPKLKQKRRRARAKGLKEEQVKDSSDLDVAQVNSAMAALEVVDMPAILEARALRSANQAKVCPKVLLVFLHIV